MYISHILISRIVYNNANSQFLHNILDPKHKLVNGLITISFYMRVIKFEIKME